MNVDEIVNFSDTLNAYKAKSDKQLKTSFRLFKILQNQAISNPLQNLLRFSVNIGLPVGPIVKATLYKQFIGGESLEECRNLVQMLAQYNTYSILDYAVEGSTDEKAYDRTIQEFLKNIELAKNEQYVPASVFKPSALSDAKTLEILSSKGIEAYNEKEKAAYQKLYDRYDQILSFACENKVPVMIDAEETWTQGIIDHLAERMMEKYNKEYVTVINTFQMYRKDRLSFLKELFRRAEEGNYFMGVKLVRGAYWEKEREVAKEKGYQSPVFDHKAETDNAFNEAVKYCIKKIDKSYLVIASHNETSNQIGVNAINETGLPADHPRIWFSQLYGMCDFITFNLAMAGYNASKYIPYGIVKSVVPYLTRRAEENSSITGHVQNEIKLIKKELQRRKEA